MANNREDISVLAALAEKFSRGEVRQREGRGGQVFDYITARTAMERLDAVVGPANWRDSYRPWGADALICRVEIRIDGEWVGREDVGGKAGMAEADDDDKSAASGAFKRACVKWGIARYLYKDASPDRSQPRPDRDPAPRGPVRNDEDQPPTSGKALFAKLKGLERQRGDVIRQVNFWGKENGLSDRMIDWPLEVLSSAWMFATGLLEGDAAGVSGGREPGAEG